MLESIGALGAEPTTGAAWGADLNAKQKLWHFDRGFYDEALGVACAVVVDRAQSVPEEGQDC